MCFFTCLYAFTHSFLSATYLSASEMYFFACSPLKKHTTCVFSLSYMLSHTAFSPLPAYQLPGWVFSPAFFYLNPRRGFFRLLPTPHAQFSLRHLHISSRFGFSRLLFSPQAHAVGFSSHILLLTPSFLSASCQSAFGARFSARKLPRTPI